MKKKKKRRIRWNNVFLFLFILIFIIILIISIINIINWLKDSKKTNNNIEEIQNNIEINEVIDSDETQVIENEVIDKEDPYWDYIEMNLIDIDFNELKQKNDQTVGWIQVGGTNINYPFVQTGDNDFYLNHSFDKSYNNAGWVFMDYRNNKTDFDKNTILYAHGRADNTMFGSLKKVIFNSWLSNKDNHIVKLSTETENTLWQVFSVYKIPTTNDYIQVHFIDDDEFLEFGNILLNRSTYDFNTIITKEDKILTLSSCYNDDEKVVLHAKLIKRELK
ncbi:MAG: class B sortase [Bacilli bacterium]|nr:class B sortase [Bacilli bacterium]